MTRPMITFTPRPRGPAPEEEPGIAWLRETLDRLAPEREMPPGSSWQIRVGVREAGSGPGLRLQQTGCQITALDAAGRAYEVTCFVSIDDTLEEELRPTVEHVLALWLDRLSVMPPG